MSGKRVMSFIAIIALVSFVAAGCAREGAEESKVAAEKETKAEKRPTPPARPVPSDEPITEERVLFSFEKDLDGWEIPDWVMDKDDHVAEGAELSKDASSEGASSLKMNCNFPGGQWTAALVELEQFFDFSPYREIAVDVYVPEGTPFGLKAKIILTVGENWKFTEMTRSISLVPGEWVTIKASIEPGSYDWKRTVPDESFRQDVRKIVVRIESNKRPIYKGPAYVDNVRIGK